MEAVKHLHADNVPTLKSVWINHTDVIGITEDGTPIVLAHIEGNSGGHGEREIKRRGPRKKKENSENNFSLPVSEER